MSSDCGRRREPRSLLDSGGESSRLCAAAECDESPCKRRGSAATEPTSRAAANSDAARPLAAPPPPAQEMEARRRRDLAYWRRRQRSTAETERRRIELPTAPDCQMVSVNRTFGSGCEVPQLGSTPASNVRSLGSTAVDIVSVEGVRGVLAAMTRFSRRHDAVVVPSGVVSGRPEPTSPARSHRRRLRLLQ